jgi:hypothetical protein
MSEGLTTPAAPAPAGPADGAIISPPATSQPPISISDAARLLSRQRRSAPAAVGSDGGDAAGVAVVDGVGRRPSPNEVAAAAKATPAAPATPATTPATPAPADTGLSAMERALGVPPAAPGAAPADGTPATPAAPAFDPATPLPSPVMIQGRQLKTLGEVQRLVDDQTADYTRKSQEQAEGRKHLEGQMQALAQVLPLIQPELQQLAQKIQQASAPEPDPRLLDSDPNQYHREKAAWDAHQREVQRIGSLTQVQEQARQRVMEQAVASANETLAKELPFWSDPQQRLEAQQAIVTWALGPGGFSRDELRGLASPHHLKTMMKAAMWDKWVAAAKTSAPATPAAPARGVAPPPALSERVAQATETFQAKPDVRGATALLAARRAAATS